MAVKEYREFFLRHGLVNSGAHPDQEVGYPDQYMVGSELKFNRWLAHDFPSQGINEKLFESLTFKLNKEDTATDAAQGLARLATYLESIGHRDAVAGQFSNVVRPSHLPQSDITLKSTDVAVGFTGDVTNGSPIIVDILNAEAALLSKGDNVKGTGITAGSIILDIGPHETSPGVFSATHSQVTININATATNANVPCTVELTDNGLKIQKVIRTFGSVKRVVYATSIDPTTLPPAPLDATNFQPVPADPTCPAAGSGTFFDISDAIPTGDYIVMATYLLSGVTGTTFATFSGLAKNGAFISDAGYSSSMAYLTGVDRQLRSHMRKVSITLGEMLQIGVNVPGDGTDGTIDSIQVTILKYA